MRATYLIFGVIMMSLIVSGFGIVISDLTSEYDVAYDESSIEVYNKMNDTISLTEDIEAKEIGRASCRERVSYHV